MNPIQFSAIYHALLNPDVLPTVKEKIDAIAENKGDYWEYFKPADYGLDNLPVNAVESQVWISFDDKDSIMTLQTNQNPHGRPNDFNLLAESNDGLIPKILEMKDSDKFAREFPKHSFKDEEIIAVHSLMYRLPSSLRENPNGFIGQYRAVIQYMLDKDWEKFEAILSHPEFDPNAKTKETRENNYPNILTSYDFVGNSAYTDYFKALFEHPKTDFTFRDTSNDSIYRWVKKKGNTELLRCLESKGIYE